MANIELPVIIPNKLLISPGMWNDNEYSAEELSNAFSRTEWNNKEKISLFSNHDDKNTNAFIGYVRNPKLQSGGKIFGDLELWDEKTAVILTQAKAKFGISAKVKGEESENGKMLNFSFENWSVVTTPACSTAYINLSKDETKISIQYLMSKDTFGSIEEIKSEEKMDEELVKIKSLSEIIERGLENMAEEKELNVVEENKVLPVATELSERDLLKELNSKFDKLVELLSNKKEEQKVDVVEEMSESKELIEVKKELAEIKKKLETPKSKTVTLSSNNVGSDVKYSANDFANFLSGINQPVKFN